MIVDDVWWRLMMVDGGWCLDSKFWFGRWRKQLRFWNVTYLCDARMCWHLLITCPWGKCKNWVQKQATSLRYFVQTWRIPGILQITASKTVKNCKITYYMSHIMRFMLHILVLWYYIYIFYVCCFPNHHRHTGSWGVPIHAHVLTARRGCSRLRWSATSAARGLVVLWCLWKLSEGWWFDGGYLWKLVMLWVLRVKNRKLVFFSWENHL